MLLANTPAGQKIGAVGEVWDKLKDSVTTTKTKSDENSDKYTMNIDITANYLDTLYKNKSMRATWRYPVYHAPNWAFGDNLGSNIDFDKSKVTSQQSYITFAITDAKMPTASFGTSDTRYQPYHESGNLFSYPTSIEMVEGHEDSKPLYDNDQHVMEWDGAQYKKNIGFTKTQTHQESTKKENHVGFFTRALLEHGENSVGQRGKFFEVDRRGRGNLGLHSGRADERNEIQGCL